MREIEWALMTSSQYVSLEARARVILELELDKTYVELQLDRI
jgi:hypothetical protein